MLDESTLRRAGDEHASIMAEQVAHLITVAELPHVHVHVIPAGAGLHIGLSGPFALARASDGTWVGHLENQLGGIVVDSEDGLHTLQTRWENVRNEALPRRQSNEPAEGSAQRSWTSLTPPGASPGAADRPGQLRRNRRQPARRHRRSDSKDPAGPALTFGAAAWRAFVAQVAERR